MNSKTLAPNNEESLLKKEFLLEKCIENIACMWVQDCYKQGISIDSNMIEEKSKSL